ncbi:hypothetical protein N7G274_004871 [Stereocaulon virgatum]|uniref:Uncharacterized protein n=1 Tax=Stereocaulon virgatum TaxID=373712 RepID=A0ABR4ABZ5_9LECA
MPPPSPSLFPQTSTNNLNLRTIPKGLDHLFAGQQSFFGRALTGLMSNSARVLARFRNAQAQIPEWFQQHMPKWLKSTRLWKILLAQGVASSVVIGGLSGVGFGSAGIGAGTLAAAWQSAAFGGLTPAMPGLFATLTSMGMTGTLMPVIVCVGLGVAVVVGGVVFWKTREGDQQEEEEVVVEEDDDDDDDGEYDYDKEVEDDSGDDVEDNVEGDAEEKYYNDDGEDRDDGKWSKVGERTTWETLKACQVQQA